MIKRYCNQATIIIETDGSCKDVVIRKKTVRQCTSAFALWLKRDEDDYNEKPVFIHSRNAGSLASSYRAEQLAILAAINDALALASHSPIDNSKKMIALLTDSQATLQSLAKEPLRQKNHCNNMIWSTLNALAKQRMRVNLVFVYGHCGDYHNDYVHEIAAKYSTRDDHHPAPLSMKECEAAIKKNILAECEASSQATDNSPRALLLHAATGELPKSLRTVPSCLLTGQFLSKAQQVQLTGIRSGHSELFGFFYAQIMKRPNVCRFCSQITEIPLVTNDMPSSEATAQRYYCQHCNHYAHTIKEVQEHQRFNHPLSRRLKGEYQCEHCNKLRPSVELRARHYNGCTERKAQKLEELNTGAESHMNIEADCEGEEETVLHLLTCEALVESRNRHNTEFYLKEYGSRYFYSLKFLRWIHDLFNGELSTPADVDEPLDGVKR